jgi:hypothetical protein
MRTVEYIWRDARSNLRSKTVLRRDGCAAAVESVCGPLMFESVSLSTPDVYLSPVRTYPDPFRGDGVLALCEVFRDVHLRVPLTGERAALDTFMVQHGAPLSPVVGLEQPVLLSGALPPADIGFYGRAPTEQRLSDVFEAFLSACTRAVLQLHTLMWAENPNTMVLTLKGDPVEVADDLLLARWLLNRVGTQHGTQVFIGELPDFATDAGFDLQLGVTLSTVFSRGPASAAALIELQCALGDQAEVPYSAKFDPNPYIRVRGTPAASDPYPLLLDVLSKTCASRVRVIDDVIG